MAKILLVVSILFLIGCKSMKVSSLAKSGIVLQTDFNETIDFSYIDKHIFVDVVINGKTYNFLFDTGWEISSIDKNLAGEINFKPVLKSKIKGSSNEEHVTNFGTVADLKISDVGFQNVGIGIEDLEFINKSYHCHKKIDGILGKNILRYAEWQIDYAKQQIKFSNDLAKLSPAPDAYVIEMIPRNSRGWGYNQIKVKINGLSKLFIFDTGSSGGITTSSNFLPILNPAEYVTIVKGNEIRGEIQFKNHIAQIEQLKISDLELEDVQMSMSSGIPALIGNQFLEHFIVTIDWNNHKLYLSPQKPVKYKMTQDFEFQFGPNYRNNRIEITGQYVTANNKKIKIGTQVTTLNRINVENFTQAELCKFWEEQWPLISEKNKVTVNFSGSDEEIVLKKLVLINE